MRSVLYLLLPIALMGCVTGVIDDGSTEGATQCPDPLRGSRYALCGRLSSSGIDNGGAGGRRVIATVDSAHDQTSSSRYTLKGGSFHAYR